MSRVREAEKDELAKTAGADRAGFVTRLRTILDQWPSADRLARAVGVSPSAFRKWLKGEAEPSRERLVSLAETAGVAVGWLANGDGPEPVFKALAPAGRGRTLTPVNGEVGSPGFVLLPKRAVAAAAGAETPHPPPPPSTEYLAFRRDWVQSKLQIDPEDLLLEVASGESMVPAIRDGDLLLIDTSDREFRSFGVYVLEFRGERLVKRVQRKLDGSLTLISDNISYEAEHLAPELVADVKGIGRVVWTCGPI